MTERAGRTGRWLVVLVVAAALVVVPLALGRRLAAASTVSAVELARRVQGSAGVAWSGAVQTSGGLQVPDSDSFATLAELLGEDTSLRVWWRGSEDWRVDRIRSTGETDLVRRGRYTMRWVFESQTATYAPVSTVRLPDASDLLPPTLARSMLQGARDAELAPLPSTRVGGIEAAGLRLTPDQPGGTVDHVDLWADPASGLAVKVELYGAGDRQPVLATTVSGLDLQTPDAASTDFTPPEDSRVAYEDAVDVAAAANAFGVVDLPATLAGLGTRNGQDPGAVGIYGRGPTTVIALPLRGQVAGPLRERLRSSASAQESDLGVLAPVGPVGVLLTPGQAGRGSVLLAGTLDGPTLQRAAEQLREAR